MTNSVELWKAVVLLIYFNYLFFIESYHHKDHVLTCCYEKEYCDTYKISMFILYLQISANSNTTIAI